MKINSKFRDYYDFAVADYGDSVVFNRHSGNIDSSIRETLLNAFDLPVVRHHRRSRWNDPDLVKMPDIISIKAQGNNDISLSFNTFSVIFCGKIYQGIQLKEYSSYTTKYSCWYDTDAITRNITAIVQDISLIDDWYDWDWSSKYKKAKYSFSQNLDSYFENNGRESPLKDFLVDQRIAIAVCLTHGKDEQVIEVNPELNCYQFYRVFDPYLAYQELEMYIGGVLACPQNFMIDVSDSTKVAKGGFDTKYGFRKRPRDRTIIT